MRDFENKVAVITGGASGIGFALAGRFAAVGMRLVLADIEQNALDVAARRLQDGGVDVLAMRVDVRKADGLMRLASGAYERFGAVHILCNNAGVIGEGAPVWEETPRNWEWVIGVNFWGVLNGVSAFVPRMIAGGEPGHILNTASLAGLTTRPFMGAYNVSKHAVVALSECLYAELALAAAPIHVSVLCPAFAKTRLADAMRNRDSLETGGDAHGFHAALRHVVEHGTPPEDIARQAFEAIQEERFWVITHPELDHGIRGRFEDMLARRNPQIRDLRNIVMP